MPFFLSDKVTIQRSSPTLLIYVYSGNLSRNSCCVEDLLVLIAGQTPYFTRAEPNLLSLCEVRLLTQLSSTDFILGV